MGLSEIPLRVSDAYGILEISLLDDYETLYQGTE